MITINGEMMITGPCGSKDRYLELCRFVDISRFASFVREFPLTYFTAYERERILEFERFIVHLENTELLSMEL